MNENTNTVLNQPLKLREVESAEIISLMDNSVDFLSTVQREEAQNVRMDKRTKRRGMDKKAFSPTNS